MRQSAQLRRNERTRERRCSTVSRRWALTFFCQHLLEGVDFEVTIGEQPLQPAVFLLQLA